MPFEAKKDWQYDDIVTERDLNRIEEGIENIHDRLDHEETASITLEPGLQIINSPKTSRFRLSSIKGRTLVNLLGQDGNCEDVSSFNVSYGGAFPSSFVVSDSEGTDGSAGIRVTWNSRAGNSFARLIQLKRPLISGRHYIALMDLNEHESGIVTRVSVRKEDTSYHLGNIEKLNGLSYVKFVADGTETAVGPYFIVNVEGTVGFDSVRLYEISESDFEAIESMTLDQISIKYPYVESIQPVVNPYVIRYGENLLPPFHEWSLANNVEIESQYSLKCMGDGTTGNSAVTFVPVNPGQIFSFNVETTGFENYPRQGVYLYFTDENKKRLNPVTRYFTSPVTVPENASYLEFVVNTDIGILNDTGPYPVAGEFTFKKPMLNVGSVVKPFKPCQETMLAFQTTLHAHPSNGSDPDELFEKSGQYYKLTKWKKVILDGNLKWGSSTFEIEGHKIIRLANILPEITEDLGDAYLKDRSTLTDFRGDPLQYFTGSGSLWTSKGYQVWNGILYLAVSNAESGWGEKYQPTLEEIKAYFLGWKMYPEGSTRKAIYNGDGIKLWVKLTRIRDMDSMSGTDDWANILPTSEAGVDAKGNFFTPYTLLYKLKTQSVKPVVSEGCLVVNEGQNLIEVGTGIVLRERANPGLNPNGIGTYDINLTGHSSLPDSELLYKARDIFGIYRDSELDNNWGIYYTNDWSYGAVRASIARVNYDQSAAYSATYLKLDKSLNVPFTGLVAVNENAMLSDLTAGVQEALTRVSVVEQKKAEKDMPGWITPTLLNGWTIVYTGTGYYKDSSGIVRFRGRISSGVTTVNTIICILPPGFRPALFCKFTIPVYTGTGSTQAGSINVAANGYVTVDVFPGNTWVHLDAISFLAVN